MLRRTHLDLEKVLRGTIDLVKRLVSRVRHRLHYRPRHACHAGHATGNAARRAGIVVLARRLGRDTASRFLV